jgi:predicted ATPase
MLRKLRIKNFKAWEDTGDLELAPLTVLFGPNSSGKSSISQFLMMLKQTVRSSDRNSVFDFGGLEDAVRLGGFREAVFSHDLERSLEFETDWRLPASMQIRDPRSSERYVGDHLFFAGSARQSPRSRVVQSEGFRYGIGDAEDNVLAVDLARDERRPDRWGLVTEGYELVRQQGRAWELPKPVKFYGFPQEVNVYFQNALFTADLELALEDQLNALSYLGPLRIRPERLYSWSGGEPEDVGWQGQNTVQAILAASGRKYNWREKARRLPFQVVVAQWLRQLGLVHSFAVEPIAPERDEYEVVVKTSLRSAPVKLTDVGFGVSQLLPVLVQCFYAPAHSTVLMEQPEIHLHPSVQANLGDLLLAATTAREDGAPRGLQLIVESHSEHLLRRILRRVAEEQIDESDVALYFCQAGEGGSTIERLRVDSFGDIHNWPEDFFGDELEDVAAQAQARIERRRQARP